MPIRLLNNFMYRFSLKTGTKVIGFSQVVLNALLTILLMTLAIHLADSIRARDPNEGVPPGMLRSVAETYVEAFFGVLLLMGVYWDKPSYIKTWVVIQFALMVQNITNICLTLILGLFRYEGMWIYSLYKTVDLSFEVYATLVVYSYYRTSYYRDAYGSLLTEEVFDSLE